VKRVGEDASRDTAVKTSTVLEQYFEKYYENYELKLETGADAVLRLEQ